MKNLNLYIKESLLDNDDALMKDTYEKAVKEVIKKFLKDNYEGAGNCKISKKPIDGKYIVDCSTSLEVENRNITSLTNEYFEFGVVDGYFNCSFCDSLILLEGAPKEVGEHFFCYDCKLLTSLEGAPKEVGGSFNCAFCDSLTSLKGAPKEVGGNFYCSKSLTSLEGAPKEVGRNFYCNDCKIQFTADDVKKVSKVKGKIFC